VNGQSALVASSKCQSNRQTVETDAVHRQRDDDLLTLRPSLSEACLVTPIVIRQEHWVIINNPLAGLHVRLHWTLWHAVQQLDGSVTVAQWLDMHGHNLTHRALLSAVLQLQRADMLSGSGGSASVETLLGRLFGRLNPLMLRVPLFNPTRMLDAINNTGLLPGRRVAFATFLSLLLCALLSLMMHWSAVLEHWKQSILELQVLHYLLVYCASKALHELAHGLVLRRLGGQIPEAGISFLVLFPMPYVDAGDAWSLGRGDRMLVTSAGMLMDLLLASLGFLLWVNLSPGLVADLAFITAFLGLISVFVFNANPLLKFDGYYLLEDALDSPGLARRSMMYCQYLFKYHVLTLFNAVPPALAQGERLWLIVYGAASTLYRFVIAAVICVFLVSTFHELGVLLSLFSLTPLLPSSSRTQGIVWVDEQAQVYASNAGQINQIFVDNGELVEQGQPVMLIESPQLLVELAQRRSAVRLAELEVSRYRQSDPVRARSAMIDLQQSQTEVDDVLARLDALTITAPFAGRFAMDAEALTKGSYVSKGQLLGYVIDNSERVIRAVVDQDDIGRVEQGVSQAHVRLASDMLHSLPARLSRQVPSASHELPSIALANDGFSGFHVQVSQQDNLVKTRDKVFHFELIITVPPDTLAQAPVGTRAFVTLIHRQESLGVRWVRIAKGLMLEHLG